MKGEYKEGKEGECEGVLKEGGNECVEREDKEEVRTADCDMK